ncbi:MAG: hypothetical protein JKY65_33245 [Planctomycetes bacterium]|nr:hypothetical protein [Planctomycetota bacterium]
MTERRGLTITETCKVYGFSRSTYNRMAEDLEREGAMVRVPPVRGRPLILIEPFEAFLKRRRRRRGHGHGVKPS